MKQTGDGETIVTFDKPHPQQSTMGFPLRTFHRVMSGAGVIAAVATVLLTFTPIRCFACEFHCRTSLCGPNVSRVTHTFEFVLWVENDNAFTMEEVSDPSTIDLRGRNITSIAPGGLACFVDSNSSASLPPLLLDDNALAALPYLLEWPAQFGQTTYISLRNNSITDITAGALTSIGTDLL